MVDIQPKKRRASKPWKPRLVRDHTMDMMAFVIYLRFNSITEEKVIARSRKEIFEITGVKPNTQSTMFARWRECGYKIYNRRLGIKNHKKTTMD
jgi:hypothetical protein